MRIYEIEFKVLCKTEKENKTLSDFTFPYISYISNHGSVRIIWNVDMNIPKNWTILTMRDSSNNNLAPINVTILPGSNKKDLRDLIITSFKVTNFTKREILI